MCGIKFPETGCLCKQKSPSKLSVSEETVERVHAMYVHSPRKSTVKASQELGVFAAYSLEDFSETISHEVLHAADGSSNYQR